MSRLTIYVLAGCTCIETDKSRSDTDCTIFTCGCLCDLNAGQCDLNCCCDTECTAVERASFATCDDANDGEGDIIETCASREVLEKINPKYPLKTGDSSSVSDVVRGFESCWIERYIWGARLIFFKTRNVCKSSYTCVCMCVCVCVCVCVSVCVIKCRNSKSN